MFEYGGTIIKPPPYVPPPEVFTPKQAGLSWVACSKGFIPPKAIEAGPGVFVARSLHKKFLIPGKIVRGHKKAYFCYNGKEHSESIYEVLCDTSLPIFGPCYSWKPYYSGNPMPQDAMVGGFEDGGDPLYIARLQIDCWFAVGKVKPMYNLAYFPFEGNQYLKHQFELLILH